MKQLGALLLPLDEMLVHCRVPSMKQLGVLLLPLDGMLADFPFMHSCAYLTHKNRKGRSLFHASASQGRMEACSFYKLHDNLRA